MVKRANFLTNRELSELIKGYDMDYYYTEFEGGHSWKSWKPMLGDILKYFLSDVIPD